MASISLCMIVKNEERVLKRCLDSIFDLVDEIIIVDTGSNDNTKDIAKEYTDKIYDFQWIDDFSAARNYSFSKCSMDYIYVADADEYLDEENRFQFKVLKDNIYPEIEIVQMMYKTISNDTVLNIFKEYRPKLFKRLREFTWINPIHETVRLDPLVFDSDIVVTHAPESNHAGRDFSIFEKHIASFGSLSDDLTRMYACELYKNGSIEDLEKSLSFFPIISDFDKTIAECKGKEIPIRDFCRAIITSKYLRLSASEAFLPYASKADVLLSGTNSEISFEIGCYYLDKKDYLKASEYFINARSASYSALDIHTSGDYALKRIIECIESVLNDYSEYKSNHSPDKEMEKNISAYNEILKKYKIDLEGWKLPEEERA